MRTRAVRWGRSVVFPLTCLVSLGASTAAAETCDQSGWFCEPDKAPPQPAGEAPSPPSEGDPDAPAAEAPATDTDLDGPPSAGAAEGSAPGAAAPGAPASAGSAPEAGPPPLAGDDLGGADGSDAELPAATPTQDSCSSAHLVESQPRSKRSLREGPRKAVSARIETALIDGKEGTDPGIGGIGVSFRLRPTSHFGFEIGLDYLTGTDWNGFSRRETVGSLGALVYFNPRSKVRVYLPVGLNLASAKVRVEEDGDDRNVRYSYIGMHAGLGAEVPVSRSVALNGELLVFMRGRTDGGEKPEFVDGNTGQTTDTSGGALLRVGASFYF